MEKVIVEGVIEVIDGESDRGDSDEIERWVDLWYECCIALLENA
jgi:hypothetical protein